MKIVNTSIDVKNISINNPRTTLVLLDNEVVTLSGPGNKADTTAAAAIAPSI